MPSVTVEPEALARARDAFPEARGSVVTPLGRGLIHATFAVESERGAFVLQRVNPIFAAAVHDDIAAVTDHLAGKGMVTPRLVRGSDGWFANLGADGIWRLQTRIAGTTFASVRGPDMARAAGAMLGRFHAALADLDHGFASTRTGVHDTAAHLAGLSEAVEGRRGHRLHDRVAALAERILAHAASLPVAPELPVRIVHGDPKLDNVVFAEGGQGPALCMVDLDTVGPGRVDHELGDALRSWCNPAGEDGGDAGFDPDLVDAALDGYLGEVTPDPAERAALVHAPEWIALELAARFARDALEERYFGWDPSRHATAGEHNLARAEVQWCVCAAAASSRSRRERRLSR